MFKLITNKSFQRNLFVLLTIVILMFLLNYLFLRNSTQLMHKQVKDNNRLVSNNIIQSFDGSFKNINSLIQSIDILPYKPLSNESQEAYNNYLIYKSLNKLISTSSASGFIEEVVVYNDNSNLAITPQGTLSLESVFNWYYQNNQYNTVYWSYYFNENNTVKVFPARNYAQLKNENVVSQKNLIVVADKIHRSFNNILIFIDVENLIESVNNELNDLSFTILDQNDEVVLNSDADINLVDMVNDFYVGEGKRRLINNQEYEYIIYKSSYNGFTYITRMPYEDGFISAMTTTHRNLMFVSILVGLFLTYLFSLYLFQPNIRIKKIIGGDYSWNNIYNTIKHLKIEKQLMETKIVSNELELRKDLFLYAIDQSREKEDLELPIEDYIGEFFFEAKFMLVKLMFKNKDGTKWRFNRSVIKIKSIMERELSLNIKKVNVFHIKDNEFLVLVNIYGNKDKATAIKNVEKLVKLTYEENNKYLGKSLLTASISRIYDSNIHNLKAAYKTIVDIPYYRNIENKTSIYDVENVSYALESYYPAEEIDKLSNLLVSGNETEARSIIKSIFDKNIEMKIQYYQFAAILQSINLNLKKHLNLTDTKQETMYNLELDLFNALREGTNFKEVEKTFMKIFSFISKELVSENESKLNQTFIAQYIELHYMESLYLEHMAEVTNTTPKYFSKYFKKTFGINFVEYLNRVRINHAKDFLKNEHYTISEVAEKIGFMHATTFSSTFKRFTGLTPTQYRSKHVS